MSFDSYASCCCYYFGLPLASIDAFRLLALEPPLVSPLILMYACSCPESLPLKSLLLTYFRPNSFDCIFKLSICSFISAAVEDIPVSPLLPIAKTGGSLGWVIAGSILSLGRSSLLKGLLGSDLDGSCDFSPAASKLVSILELLKMFTGATTYGPFLEATCSGTILKSY